MQTQLLRSSFVVAVPAQSLPFAPSRSFLSAQRAPLPGQSKPRSRTAELQVSATKDKKPSLFVEETGSPNPTILAVGVLFALVAAALVAALFIPKYSGQEESGEKAFQADPSKQKGATPLPAGPAPKGYDYKQTPPAVKAEGKKGQPAGLD